LTLFPTFVKLGVFAGVVLQFASIAAAQTVKVVPAPVPPDGYYAGTATHLVFVLVPNSDPSVKGIGLQKADTLAIILPKEFKRQENVAIREDSDFNLVLPKGWPQAPVKQAGQYKIFFDEKTNAIGVRADTDIGTYDANAPGIKMMHLRGGTFLNPAPGNYKAEVRHADANGKTKQTWTGVINIAAGPMAGRVAPTNFQLGPNENSDFQEMGQNQDAPKMFGVFVWDSGGKLKNGVGIADADHARFPKYDHLLVAAAASDKVLNSASGDVIGGTIVATPPGANGQTIASPHGAGGKQVLSGEVLRSAKFPEAAGGGKPADGLLPIVFHSGDKSGPYRLRIEMIGGNTIQYTFTVH
jgi:hypothetical protein